MVDLIKDLPRSTRIHQPGADHRFVQLVPFPAVSAQAIPPCASPSEDFLKLAKIKPTDRAPVTVILENGNAEPFRNRVPPLAARPFSIRAQANHLGDLEKPEPFPGGGTFAPGGSRPYRSKAINRSSGAAPLSRCA